MEKFFVEIEILLLSLASILELSSACFHRLTSAHVCIVCSSRSCKI